MNIHSNQFTFNYNEMLNIYVQNAENTVNIFVLCILKRLSFLLKGEGIAQTV
jgi:hypothetical protein